MSKKTNKTTKNIRKQRTRKNKPFITRNTKNIEKVTRKTVPKIGGNDIFENLIGTAKNISNGNSIQKTTEQPSNTDANEQARINVAVNTIRDKLLESMCMAIESSVTSSVENAILGTDPYENLMIGKNNELIKDTIIETITNLFDNEVSKNYINESINSINVSIPDTLNEVINENNETSVGGNVSENKESEKEVTASEHEVTASENEVTASEHEVTASEHEVTASENEVTASENEVTASENEVTASENEESEKEVTASENNVEESGNKGPINSVTDDSSIGTHNTCSQIEENLLKMLEGELNKTINGKKEEIYMMFKKVIQSSSFKSSVRRAVTNVVTKLVIRLGTEHINNIIIERIKTSKFPEKIDENSYAIKFLYKEAKSLPSNDNKVIYEIIRKLLYIKNV